MSSTKDKNSALKKKIHAIANSFLIQAGHPTALSPEQKEFAEVAEAFPHIFSENDESAYLYFWKVPVRFSYTYGLYANVDDLLEWLERLITENSGSHELILSTEAYLITIKANWQNNGLKLELDWMEKRSHRKIAELLNKKGPILIKITNFLKEWKIILYQVINAVEKSGVVITDPNEKEKILRLKKIVNRIEGRGKIYALKDAG